MIPKIVHLSWPTRKVLDSHLPMVQLGVKRFQSLNPSWTICLSEDQEVRDYLRQHCSEYSLLENAHIVSQLDLWRLYKVYLEGGLYMDLDRLCDQTVNPDPGIKWVLPTYLDVDFSQDIVCSEPGNPAILAAINLQLYRRRQGYTDIYLLGPQTYMHAITQTIFGQMIDPNPGVEVFSSMRQVIKNTPWICEYRETPPCATVLYKGEAVAHEQMKRDLYSYFNLKHWTQEW